MQRQAISVIFSMMFFRFVFVTCLTASSCLAFAPTTTQSSVVVHGRHHRRHEQQRRAISSGYGVLSMPSVVLLSSSSTSAFDDYDMSDPEQTLAFQDEVVGDGDEAEKGKMVTVSYKGTLLDSGEEFDSNDFGISFVLGDGKVIPGTYCIGGRRTTTSRTIQYPVFHAMFVLF